MRFLPVSTSTLVSLVTVLASAGAGEAGAPGLAGAAGAGAARLDLGVAPSGGCGSSGIEAGGFLMERRFFATVDSSKLTGAVVLVGELGAVEPGVDVGLGPVPGVFFLIDRRRFTGSAAAAGAGAASSAGGFAGSFEERDEERLGLGGKTEVMGGRRTAWEEEEVEISVGEEVVVVVEGTDLGASSLGCIVLTEDRFGLGRSAGGSLGGAKLGGPVPPDSPEMEPRGVEASELDSELAGRRKRWLGGAVSSALSKG